MPINRPTACLSLRRPRAFDASEPLRHPVHRIVPRRCSSAANRASNLVPPALSANASTSRDQLGRLAGRQGAARDACGERRHGLGRIGGGCATPARRTPPAALRAAPLIHRAWPADTSPDLPAVSPGRARCPQPRPLSDRPAIGLPCYGFRPGGQAGCRTAPGRYRPPCFPPESTSSHLIRLRKDGSSYHERRHQQHARSPGRASCLVGHSLALGSSGNGRHAAAGALARCRHVAEHSRASDGW